jgi:hypothetical protein
MSGGSRSGRYTSGENAACTNGKEAAGPKMFWKMWSREGGGEVTLARQPRSLYPQQDSWYSFLIETESNPGPQCSGKG